MTPDRVSGGVGLCGLENGLDPMTGKPAEENQAGHADHRSKGVTTSD